MQPLSHQSFDIRRIFVLCFFKIDTIAYAAQNLITGTKHTIEELELLIQQFIHTYIGRITFIEEVHNYDIEFLSISVASTYSLFDPLWIPWHIIVHYQRAELQIVTLGGSFGSNHDSGFILKIINDSRLACRPWKDPQPYAFLCFFSYTR